MTYKIKLIDKKDPLSQLEASESSIKDLFNDLLDETKGFKYQITAKILFQKYKDTEIEFSPVYFNSKTKTVLNHKIDLDKSFQKISHRTDNWSMKDLVGLLNQLILNTLVFQLLEIIRTFLHKITC